MAGCGDVLSLEDLQTAKKHQIFEAEVITGKAGGVAGGGPIDYATNQVTGQVQKTMPAILRDLGFVSAAFDFTSGGTLTTSDRNTAVLWPVSGGGDGDWYVWGGALPKVVPAGSSPTSTGGVTLGAWSNVGSVILRQELATAGGAGLVGGVAKPVTWSGFAGGADPTGVTSSDAAFAAAVAYDEEVYIPSGAYNLTGSYNGRFTFADGVIFNGVGSAYKKDTGFNASTTGAASITRFNRVFVGDAAYSNDGRAGGTTTWLGKKDYVAPNGTLQPGLTWPERTAQFSSITSKGGCAVLGGAHTKELTGGSSQALVGIAVNDNESVLTSCRGMYLDAKRYPNSVGPAYAAEMQITNLGAFVDEYASSTQKTFGLSLFSGGDPVINGLTEDVTTALSIANNGSRFGTGISYSASALRVISEAGLADYGRAMALRGGQRIGWEDGAGVTRSYINSVVIDTTKRVGILFQNGVIDLNGPSSIALRASGSVGDSGYLRVNSTDAVNQNVRLTIEGLTDSSLTLEGKGTGNIIVNKSIRGSAANALQCGTAAFPWSTGFTQAAFTVTSDENYKSSPEPITDAMLDAAAEVEWCMFQYLDRIEAKGADGARWHFGAMAQRFVEAFERHGLKPYRFAFICYDEWEDRYVKVQTNEGETVTKTRTVSQPVMVTTTRDVMVDEVLEDGTKIKKAISEEYQTPKLAQVYIYNEDGSPRLDDNGVRAFVMEPVMEDIIEEYTEPAPPEYVDVLDVPAGSRYGIRYDQAIILKQTQIERDHKRQLDAFVARIEALEYK